MTERLFETEAQEQARPIVLVVDDVPENLATIAGMVGSLGIDVRVANSGPAALKYARVLPAPDLILLDVMMPGMDGFAVMAELRAAPETRDISVIFVTALDDATNEEVGLKAGAVDYIAKPVKPELLKARVLTQIELKRNRDLAAGQKAWLAQEVERRVAENDRLRARLQLALAAADISIWEYDHQSRQGEWSESLNRLLGIEQGPRSIEDILALCHPEDRPALESWLREFLQEGKDLTLDGFRVRHRDGHWVWLEARGSTIQYSDDGTPLLTVGTIADVSRRKEAEAELRLASVVFTGISDGICITDTSGRILLTNDSFTRLTGYQAGEVLGKNPRVLNSGIHGVAFFKDMWDTLLRLGNWQGEITNRRKDGELVTEWLSISAVCDSAGRPTHYVGIFSDLSERKAAAERIQYLSSFDPLTDLPNRNLFADRLGQALLNARRYERSAAVVLVDLDRFRLVNDTLGPPAGDTVLIEVARRLSLQVRDGDTVGRRSGNEFGCVLANLGQEHDVIALAQRMLDAIVVPFDVNGQPLALTASIGISMAPRDGDTVDLLLKSAGAALLRAKKGSRNSFCFYSPELDADATRRLGLEAALREALARNEFSVVYQPQVSLDRGNMVGMEALLRWDNAQFGAVSPSEFIPIAEDNGMILPIGEWVLRTACLQTRQWLDLGLVNLRIAVNLSARQFRQPKLIEMVAQTLAETGLDAGALELEITESAFIDDVDAAVSQCRALKALGVKLSLDDFGTGYSSLAYISRFPFDKLKIDQGFVRDIVENPVNAAIATAAIVMARSLNLMVLAEGVETEAQANFLRGKRCDAMQGYLFSRPLTPADFGRLLAVNKRLPLVDVPRDSDQTLLLVDDEPNILSSLSRLLRREGYRILTATSPAEAFELLAKQPVHVIVSDQRMPDMSGTEFFARVRQLYPDTIRLVLTGYTDIESVTGAINRGAIYKFLTKPWDDDLLREHIREAFRLVKENNRRIPAPTTTDND